MPRTVARNSTLIRTAAALAGLAGLVLSPRGVSPLGGAPAAAQVLPRGAQTVPTLAYDAALSALAAGDYQAALDTAAHGYAGGVRTGNQRWIDSIPSAVMVGEARWELGNLREALAAYDEAILLGAAHAEWLLAVQFPTQALQPVVRPRVATWGRSTRGTKPAALPDTMSIRQGGGDPQQVLRQGGVLSAPVNVPLRPQEIMKALVIALYRRGTILGPLAGEGTSIDEINTALSKRPAPAGHWSQAWIDVALGTAAWSQGRNDQALPLLERGVAFGGKLDHPLTAWGLLVAGRIAMEKDDAVGAARLFEEASYAAAEFGDTRALEESLRRAFEAHQAAGTPGVPGSVQGACEWSKGTLPVLRATLLAAEAEVLAAAGNPQAAASRLAGIDARLLRGACGVAVAHAAATVAYAGGETAAGDADLAKALAAARPRSPRLFQTARLLEQVMAGANAISDRQADLLFARLLGDPAPREFVVDPVESLVAVTTPRPEAFEAWEMVALRRGSDAALAAGEQALRSRWMSLQPAGGRRIGLERLLGADAARLPRDAIALRRGIVDRHPGLSKLLDEDTRLRTALSATLAGAAGQDQPRGGPPGDAKVWDEFAVHSARRSAAIDLLAAGREAIAVDFPPRLPPADIRARLAPGEAILSFRWTAAGLRGTLETRDRAASWQVRATAELTRELAHLARALCLFDPHAPVPTDRIAASDWRSHAAAVERLLFEPSRVTLGEGIDDLAIVPDGALWYLPFELLPVGSARDPQPDDAADAAPPMLRDECRVRYAPTRSLAVTGVPSVADGAPAAVGPIGIHAGHAPRGEKPELIAEAARRLATTIERTLPLAVAPTPGHGGTRPELEAALCEGIVVLDEIDLAGESPVAARGLFGRHDRAGRGGGTFAEWLASPHKRPTRVALPGMQTPMAAGLAKPVARPGEELFVAATDLLAAGARTALLARWRVGGKSSTDLVTEFFRDVDAPDAVPAASWSRAVDLVTAEEPDPALEGRLRVVGQTLPPDLRHPFFWSGYLLVDGGTAPPPPPPAARAPGLPAAKVPAPKQPGAEPAAPKGPAPKAPAAKRAK